MHVDGAFMLGQWGLWFAAKFIALDPLKGIAALVLRFEPTLINTEKEN